MSRFEHISKSWLYVLRPPCHYIGLNNVDIPRNGIATIGQIQAGTQALFNMGADLSALLSVGGALDGGDILSTL